jgi:hypothetical protein
MAAEGDLGRIGVSGLGSIKNKKMFESHSLVTEGNGEAERVSLTRRRGVWILEDPKARTSAEPAEGVVSLRTERTGFRERSALSISGYRGCGVVEVREIGVQRGGFDY